jgi:hypothetical protein
MMKKKLANKRLARLKGSPAMVVTCRFPEVLSCTIQTVAITIRTRALAPHRGTGRMRTITVIFFAFALGLMLDAIGAPPIPDLRRTPDPVLQRRLEGAIRHLGLRRAVLDRRLAVALVDVTRVHRPRLAAVNGDEMLYAASLPKIAILLGAFVEIERGRIALDNDTRASLTQMIRVSSNEAATEMLRRIGMGRLAAILRSPRYGLYDPRYNGGLWVGKEYGRAAAWRRDPLHHLSHGATAFQTARCGATGLPSPHPGDEGGPLQTRHQSQVRQGPLRATPVPDVSQVRDLAPLACRQCARRARRSQVHRSGPGRGSVGRRVDDPPYPIARCDHRGAADGRIGWRFSMRQSHSPDRRRGCGARGPSTYTGCDARIAEERLRQREVSTRILAL